MPPPANALSNVFSKRPGGGSQRWTQSIPVLWAPSTFRIAIPARQAYDARASWTPGQSNGATRSGGQETNGLSSALRDRVISHPFACRTPATTPRASTHPARIWLLIGFLCLSSSCAHRSTSRGSLSGRTAIEPQSRKVVGYYFTHRSVRLAILQHSKGRAF